jgi:hypothetical protein
LSDRPKDKLAVHLVGRDGVLEHHAYDRPIDAESRSIQHELADFSRRTRGALVLFAGERDEFAQ